MVLHPQDQEAHRQERRVEAPLRHSEGAVHLLMTYEAPYHGVPCEAPYEVPYGSPYEGPHGAPYGAPYGAP